MSDASFHPDDHREETDDELVAYLDGELTAEQSQKIELRLASDPGYRKRLRELEKTWDLLEELPTGEPTESFTRSTIELVLSEDVQLQRKKQRKAWTVPLRLLAFSALPLALFGGAYSVTRSIQNQPYQALLRDLPVIENVDLFNKVDDIRFLEMLDQEGLFGDGMGGSNQ